MLPICERPLKQRASSKILPPVSGTARVDIERARQHLGESSQASGPLPMGYSGAGIPDGVDHPNIIEKECRMSVIAKLDLLAVRAFGGGSLYEMSCVCQDDLMAMYAKRSEERRVGKECVSTV